MAYALIDAVYVIGRILHKLVLSGQQQYLNKLRRVSVLKSFQIVRFGGQEPHLCMQCTAKLDAVYDFVAKFNLSKLKLKQYAEHEQFVERDDPDPFRIGDLNLEKVDGREVN